MTKYKKVIVIGYGTIVTKVLRTVWAKASEYGYTPQFIEHEVHPFNAAKNFVRANAIDYRRIEDKKNLLGYFLEQAKEDFVLIISANNNFLFPKELVDNGRIDIVNFHNALLPDYRGRNVASWMIYNGEKEAGITWHYANAGVDTGDVIIQKNCEVPDDIRAYELVARLMDLGADAFAECYDSVLTGTAGRKSQQGDVFRRRYRSTEIPGGGCFRLSDRPEDIYRLLRALDYGKNEIFPLPVTELDGKKIAIKRYRLVGADERKDEGQRIYIPFAGKFLMLCYAG